MMSFSDQVDPLSFPRLLGACPGFLPARDSPLKTSQSWLKVVSPLDERSFSPSLRPGAYASRVSTLQLDDRIAPLHGIFPLF